MITTNYKRARTIVITALFVVMIDTIYALIFIIIDLKRETLLESTIFLVLFDFPLILLGYLLWFGRRFAAILLAVFLFAHGLLYLLGFGLVGNVLILMLAALNIVIAVFLFRSDVAKFQESKTKK